MVRRALAALVSAVLVLTGMTAVGAPAQAAPSATASVAVRVLTQHDQLVTQSFVDLRHAASGAPAGSEGIDRDGWTRFTGLAAGRYRAVVRDPLGAPAERAVEFSLAAGENSQQTIRVTVGQTISGRVTVAGAPWAGVGVAARKLTGSRTTYYGPTAVTDVDGRFTIVVAPGTYVLVTDDEEAPADGPEALRTYSGDTIDPRRAAKVTAAAGVHLSQDIAAVVTSTVVGRLVDERGRPVRTMVSSEALSREGPADTSSDTDGSFTLKGLVSGRHRLSFGDGEFVTTLTTPALPQGATHDVGTLTLRRPAGWGESWVTGKVLGPIGTESRPTTVYLKNARGKVVQQTSVWVDIDSKRRFSFANVPAGRYRVVIPQTGQSVSTKVGKGKTSSVRLRFALAKKRGDALVRVVHPKTKKPARGAKVEVCTKVCFARGDTNSKGRVRLKNLVPGRYTIRVSTGRSSSVTVSKVRVRAGATSTTTRRVPVDGAVKGVVKGVAEARVRLVPLSGSPTWTFTNGREGKFVVRDVPPGRYRVVVRDLLEGGESDIYYKGTSLTTSKVITVKSGRTVNLGTLAFSG